VSMLTDLSFLITSSSENCDRRGVNTPTFTWCLLKYAQVAQV
jgi:hypothetical protein